MSGVGFPVLCQVQGGWGGGVRYFFLALLTPLSTPKQFRNSCFQKWMHLKMDARLELFRSRGRGLEFHIYVIVHKYD